MTRRDSDGAGLIGLILIIALVLIIVYIIVLAFTVIIGTAMVSGTVYGGYKSIRNYCSSFNENMIQSNKKAA